MAKKPNFGPYYGNDERFCLMEDGRVQRKRKSSEITKKSQLEQMTQLLKNSEEQSIVTVSTLMKAALSSIHPNDSSQNISSIFPHPNLSDSYRIEPQFCESLYYAAVYYFAIKKNKYGNLLMAISYFLITVQIYCIMGLFHAAGTKISEYISKPLTLMEFEYYGLVLYEWIPCVLVCMLVRELVSEEIREIQLIFELLVYNKVHGARAWLVMFHTGCLRMFLMALVSMNAILALADFNVAIILLSGLAFYCVLEVDDALYFVCWKPKELEDEATFFLTVKRDDYITLSSRLYGLVCALATLSTSFVNAEIFSDIFIKPYFCKSSKCNSIDLQVAGLNVFVFSFTIALFFGLLKWLMPLKRLKSFEKPEISAIGMKCLVVCKYLLAIAPAVTILILVDNVIGHLQADELEPVFTVKSCSSTETRIRHLIKYFRKTERSIAR